MRVFEVLLNGKVLCRAGTNDECAMSCIVANVKNRNTEDCWVNVSASVGPEPKHVNWVHQRELIIGDEISIRVVEADTADDPIELKK